MLGLGPALHGDITLTSLQSGVKVSTFWYEENPEIQPVLGVSSKMQVYQILKAKTASILFTVSSSSLLSDAVELLSSESIGSVVVLGENELIAGIFSERDIVRALAKSGASCLKEQVDQFMTTAVETCSLTDSGDDVLHRMTEGRFRHMPVIKDGVLVGIITIGDVVKSQLDELARENEAMQSMIKGY